MSDTTANQNIGELGRAFVARRIEDGICPETNRLCTVAARQIRKWADGRVCFQVVPEIVAEEWGIETKNWRK
jgi:hypothetical protein